MEKSSRPVEPSGSVVRRGGGEVEAEVLGGDKVVAEEDYAAEGERGEKVGLSEAAEYAVAEVAVRADEASDETFGAEEFHGGRKEVGGQGVIGVRFEGPGTEAVPEAVEGGAG